MKKQTAVFRGQLYTAAVVCAAMFLLHGCGTKTKAEWQTNYAEAKKLAAAQNRGVAVLFTGISWDGISRQLNDDVFSADKFLAQLSKDFVPVSIDFPQLPENPDEETLEKLSVAEKFYVQRTPALILETADEFVAASVSFDSPDITAPTAFKMLKQAISNADELTALRKKIEKSSGIEKAGFIADMIRQLESVPQGKTAVLAKEALALDPENATGKMIRLKMLAAYSDAVELFRFGKVEDAVGLFTAIAEDAHASAAEIQEAYHNAAYLHAMAGNEDEIIIGYLQKAYDAAPDSESAVPIRELIEQMKSREGPVQ
ncbi:MAG: thioredoxin family protein [Treponema brennaborense]|nr:thioredoxin family protein [Treponema brennaborense]